MSPRVLQKRQSGQSGAIITDDRSNRIGYIGDWYDVTISGSPAIHNGTLSEIATTGGGYFFGFTGALNFFRVRVTRLNVP